MEVIDKYFPNLSVVQHRQFAHLGHLYHFWNQKINLVSRKDTENLFEHHILHSLAIAKFMDFTPGTKILDIGTGGGLPGIPLAILFPDVQFTLVDAIEKKIRAVNVIYRALALQNVTAEQQRAETMKGGFDFVVSRAVTSFLTLYNWSARMVLKRELNPLPNGIITLKGGNLGLELAPFVNDVYQFPLTDYFQEEHFIDKYLVYLPVY